MTTASTWSDHNTARRASAPSNARGQSSYTRNDAHLHVSSNRSTHSPKRSIASSSTRSYGSDLNQASTISVYQFPADPQSQRIPQQSTQLSRRDSRSIPELSSSNTYHRSLNGHGQHFSPHGICSVPSVLLQTPSTVYSDEEAPVSSLGVHACFVVPSPEGQSPRSRPRAEHVIRPAAVSMGFASRRPSVTVDQGRRLSQLSTKSTSSLEQLHRANRMVQQHNDMVMTGSSSSKSLAREAHMHHLDPPESPPASGQDLIYQKTQRSLSLASASSIASLTASSQRSLSPTSTIGESSSRRPSLIFDGTSPSKAMLSGPGPLPREEDFGAQYSVRATTFGGPKTELRKDVKEFFLRFGQESAERSSLEKDDVEMG